ncbi:hypothetical protein ACLOJK_010699 [Asimina triloba]
MDRASLILQEIEKSAQLSLNGSRVSGVNDAVAAEQSHALMATRIETRHTRARKPHGCVEQGVSDRKDFTFETFRSGTKVHVDVVVGSRTKNMTLPNCGVAKEAAGGKVATKTMRMMGVTVVKGRIEDEGVADDSS